MRDHLIPLNLPVPNRIAQSDIDKVRAAHIPHRGEPGKQRLPRILGRVQRLLRHRLPEAVDGLLLPVVALHHREVRVRIHESGQ